MHMSKKFGLCFAANLVLVVTLATSSANAGSRGEAKAAPSLLEAGWRALVSFFVSPYSSDLDQGCKIDPLGQPSCSQKTAQPEGQGCKIDPLGHPICTP